MKIYKINNLSVNDELSKKTGCTKEALNNIVKKGQGAYYSSGSRPNQTSHSWGIARLGSTITSGKAAVVDYKILENVKYDFVKLFFSELDEGNIKHYECNGYEQS